jgi:hypothetical protein
MTNGRCIPCTVPNTGTGISFHLLLSIIMRPATFALRQLVKDGCVVTRLSSKATWKFIRPVIILFILCQFCGAFKMSSFTRMNSFSLGSRMSSAIVSELKPLLSDSNVRESDLLKVAEYIYSVEVLHEDRINEFQSKFSLLQMNHQYKKELFEIGNKEFTMNSVVEKKFFANSVPSFNEIMISNYIVTISHLQKHLEAHEHYHMKVVSLLTQRDMFERLFSLFY